MSSIRIVEPLDVVEHIGFGVFPRAVLLVIDPFLLQGPEEALLHGRVVPHTARGTHAAGDALLAEQSLELLAGGKRVAKAACASGSDVWMIGVSWRPISTAVGSGATLSQTIAGDIVHHYEF